MIIYHTPVGNASTILCLPPKYRRKNIYRALKKDIGKILRQLCELKKVEILEAEACPDHIHMLVSISPNISVSQFMGYLKERGKSKIERTCCGYQAE